jgi:two-component system response regulator HydG
MARKKPAPAFFDRSTPTSRPLLGVVADSGQIARSATKAGADFLLALSAGVFRNHGLSALASFLPYHNSNDLTEALVRDRVLPAAGPTPVFAGVLAGDPTQPLLERFDRLRAHGVAGVINYPSVTLLDGLFREVFESEGCTVDAETTLLAEAKRRGLAALGFVGGDLQEATRFAASGVDAVILTPGVTQVLDDIHERRDRLQHDIRRLNLALKAVRRVNPRVLCLVYGGTITAPEDLEHVYRQTGVDGFVGGSIFGRYPIEIAVETAVRRFRSVVVHPEAERSAGLGPMIGTTPAMRELFRLIRRAAVCELSVCIEGESGVGKELVATHIHRLSGRANGPLVTLNCGAIPDSLLESEFFGHERGSFTGADHRRLGKFELAHNGTLFLDEVGDLTPRGQVALLRAIQQREITRVGGNTSISVNIRIVSASNQPLSQLVTQGRFRADLYYRLNNLTLNVPPLRDRVDDIPRLVEPILTALSVQMDREIMALAPQFLEKLHRHDWPGNLRELQHVLAQAALLEDGPLLTGRGFAPAAASHPDANPPSGRTLSEEIDEEVRRSRARRVEQALRDANGNKSQAAALLGVSRKTLYTWLDQTGT